MGGIILKPKKCVLLLGGSTDQLFIIKTANKLGLETAVIDASKTAPGLSLGTYSAPIDFSNIPAVVDYAHQLKKQGVNVCGVTVMGSDVPHIVSAIAKEFNWIGLSGQTGKWATDKYEMKCRFVKKGIPVPKFALVKSSEDVMNCWKDWNCSSVVIKPTDRAGSRGVRIISQVEEVKDAFKNALICSKNGKVILEEYVPGLQISTESVLTEKRSMTPGFADRVYGGMDVFWPQIMENGGWVPSLVNHAMHRTVCNLVENAARALGIQRGVAKGDVVIHPEKGPMIIEMAARLSGGDFSESLVPLGIGVNYVKAVLKIAIGEEPNWDDMLPKWESAVANRYFFLPPGKLEDIEGMESIRKIKAVKKLKMFYEIGDTVPEITHHGQRVGVAVIVGKNRKAVQRNIDKVYQNIKFKINGRWVSGDPSKFDNLSYTKH